MNQLLLFKDRPDLVDAFNRMDVKAMVHEPAPIARHSDPTTSHQAAAETQSKLKKTKAYCVAVMTGKLGPRTAQEIALEASQRFGGMTDTYRKRPHELVEDGVFEECGFRKCTVTGKNAQTFRARGTNET